MITQHTPGPWHVVEREFGYPLFPEERHNPLRLDASGATVIGCIGCIKGMGPADQANARLIAAAPELLEALVQLLHETDGGVQPCGRSTYDRATAAIAKATGRPN